MAGKRLVRDIDLTARRLLLISVVRPTLEYGSEVREGNKAEAAALESVMIGGAKRILGCSSRTCNEAVSGDMELYSLQGRRDKAKLKWWYKVATGLDKAEWLEDIRKGSCSLKSFFGVAGEGIDEKESI